MTKFSQLIQKLIGRTSLATQKLPTLHDLIESESLVGGQLFGDAPSGTTRQFFYMNHHDWFYITTYKAADGTTMRKTIRFEVTLHGVIKSIDGKGHEILNGEEYANFIEATRRYGRDVHRSVYQPIIERYPVAA